MDNNTNKFERNSTQLLRDLPVGSRFRFMGKYEVHEVMENDMKGGDVKYNQDDGFGGYKKRFDDKKSAYVKVVYLRHKNDKHEAQASSTQN